MRALLVLWLVALLVSPAAGLDRIRVVTTLPDLADWVREIGGDRVEVRSLLRGFENPHTYEPRVSDVKAVAGSRVLVRVGLGLEEWLDGLVENSRNSELIQIVAAEGVPVLDAGEHQAHGHAAGNPHVWLDPGRAAIMCRNIARGLEAADPFAGSYYQERLRAYLARLERTAEAIRQQVRSLKDRRFISYHPAWPYFAEGLGFELVGVVTRVPGQEPSARSLARLVDRIRAERIPVLVTEPQLPSEIPELLREETGIRVVTLSPILGVGPAKTYLELLERNATLLIEALSEASP